MTMMSSCVRTQEWGNLVKGIFNSSEKTYNRGLNCNSMNSRERFTTAIHTMPNTNSLVFFLINT